MAVSLYVLVTLFYVVVFYIGVYFNFMSALYSLLYSSWLPLGFNFAVFICRSLSQQLSFFIGLLLVVSRSACEFTPPAQWR